MSTCWRFLKNSELVFLTIALALLHSNALAQSDSINEIHFQEGTLNQVGTGGAMADTTIFTFQHVSSWGYGDNFLFFDHTDFDLATAGSNPANPGSDTSDIYGEWYSHFSLSKITGNEVKFGIVRDVGFLAGLNWAPDVDSWWFLPGVRFSLDLPGFAFANLDFTTYNQHSTTNTNATTFGILDEERSWMSDFSWAYPFSIGRTNWSLEGHIEYIEARRQVTTFGAGKLESWVLAQPQLRLDLGDLLDIGANKLFVGVEYQYWNNKLGEKDTDDRELQFLLVWRL
jgi:nucleoside-specific outer membrane channel protein Tsx